jgi:capsular polysaccharide biosynthesis protein
MSRHDSNQDVFPTYDLPTNVFLSRRGTRALTNEAAIEALLSARGFVKVYAEDLSLPEQFALFRQAEEIVGIHGAGLAPLQYRSPSSPALRFVELAPIGIMTRWFGIMCEQVGGKYAAVRGRIRPEYVPHLYRDEPYLKDANDSFEVDPKSLEKALEIVRSSSTI